MLKNSFIHLPGVGRATERRLWQAGVHSWDDVLSRPDDVPVGPRARDRLCRGLEASMRALDERNWMFFYESLPACEEWRMLHNLPARIAYVDIETTGLSPEYNDVTCIGLYDGEKARSYVFGENLDEFASDIEAYDIVVTYNGKTFDMPFLHRKLGFVLEAPHVDLVYVSHSVGLKGGLKAVEHKLGIGRAEELEGVDGFMAVLLWTEYQRTGDRRALETLIAYNLTDTINLLTLSRKLWNQRLPAHFLHHRLSVEHHAPRIPWKADGALVKRIRSRLRGG